MDFFNFFEERVQETLARATWFSLLDILLVAFVIYQFLLLIKGTRAFQVIKGLCVLLGVWYLAGKMGLYTFHWLLGRALLPGVIALVILFQPELRLALERLGRGRLPSGPWTGTQSLAGFVNELWEAVEELSLRKIGALIVLQRQTNLREVIETGEPIQARFSADLLLTLFYPNTPLHDGAVVVQGDTIVAARCLLPLSDRTDLAGALGTRHRAALGLAERTDAVVVVVSEETGRVSLAYEGELHRNLTEEAIKERILGLLQPLLGAPTGLWRKR